ncbi:MAG TPA: GFA family protein, partial [Burkholderiaceae bacterium]|nr:GFA family protein [Burkholderiaceae bacterium]
GTLMWFVPRTQLRLLTPPEAMSTYTFHKHIIQHNFCPTCGIHPYGEGTDPKGNAMAAVNIRSLEGVDIYDIPVQHFDGRAM